MGLGSFLQTGLPNKVENCEIFETGESVDESLNKASQKG